MPAPHPATDRDRYDAIVIGSGPNGLAAAIRLASDGLAVLVVERAVRPGGGARTEQRTIPGFHHDTCSAVHPMGLASPYLSSLPLDDYGLQWVHPEVPLAHPFDDRPAALMLRSVEETATLLGGKDDRAYRNTYGSLVEGADDLFGQLLGPFRFPKRPLQVAGFGLDALRPATWLARSRFASEEARALFAGHAAHSVMPLEAACTSAIALMLSIAGHAVGWPVAKGGSGEVTRALVAHFESLGGELVTGWEVGHLSELPAARAYLFDTSPAAMARIASDRLPAGYLRRLSRFKHGAGVFKIDWALDEPIPWSDPTVAKAGTVHVGGTLEEIAAAERLACATDGNAGHAERPFVLLAQPTACDPSRAPEGKHVAWGYCHVPNGSDVDMTEAIESQVERFAPGFREVVAARASLNCADYEAYNPNLVGGDVTGGLNHWSQLYTRPVARWNPYTTPEPDLFICSSSTPPGGGVHGMCGYWAAEAALRRLS